jgi:nitroreductase
VSGNERMKESHNMFNSFSELVKSRRSIRKYLDKKISRDNIKKCLEAARLAPSAENVQPWRFIVLDDPELLNNFTREAFSGIYLPTKFARKAPVIIVMLAKLDLFANRIGKQIQGIHYYFIDVGIAGEHLVLQARELGLATCWIGWFHPKKVRKFLKIPKSYKIVSLMSMGYSAEEKTEVTNRLPLDKITWFNGFKHQEKS